jgi:hypothetical protein
MAGGVDCGHDVWLRLPVMRSDHRANPVLGRRPSRMDFRREASPMTLHTAQTYGLALVLAYVLYSVGGWVFGY